MRWRQRAFNWRTWRWAQRPRKKSFGFITRRFSGPEQFAETMSQPVRVAHLSDQHVGLVTPMDVQMEAVRLTNEAQPDLVVITGDFIAHSLAYFDDLATITRAFEAPVVGVLGNHDHWAGGARVRQVLEQAGMCVLQNENTVLKLNGEHLQIVGVDDSYTGHADRQKALRGMKPDLPTIGLTHIPEEADGLWEAGVSMVFAGHTHGGQVSIGGLPEVAIGKIGGHKYVHGLYGSRKKGAGALYVSAGVGAAVMPLRIGTRGQREVTFFDLGEAPGSQVEDHQEQEALPGRKPSEKLKAKRFREVGRRVANRKRRKEIRELFRRIRRG